MISDLSQLDKTPSLGEQRPSVLLCLYALCHPYQLSTICAILQPVWHKTFTKRFPVTQLTSPLLSLFWSWWKTLLPPVTEGCRFNSKDLLLAMELFYWKATWADFRVCGAFSNWQIGDVVAQTKTTFLSFEKISEWIAQWTASMVLGSTCPGKKYETCTALLSVFLVTYLWEFRSLWLHFLQIADSNLVEISQQL